MRQGSGLLVGHGQRRGPVQGGLGHLVGDERRFDGARMLGVDEHVWRHAPRGGRYVTVAVNPTPRRDGRPARLLDMVEGKEREGVRRLARRAAGIVPRQRPGRGDGRVRRIQEGRRASGAPRGRGPRPVPCGPACRAEAHQGQMPAPAGDRRTAGTRSDPLYRCGRILLKTESPRTDRQREKADEILADPANGPLRLAHGACKGCPELSVLGRTMKKRMRDILAFFDWDNNANGPTEAINGRLETLRGIALGFTNLGNYVTRSLLHAGGFRQAIQPHLR